MPLNNILLTTPAEILCVDAAYCDRTEKPLNIQQRLTVSYFILFVSEEKQRILC